MITLSWVLVYTGIAIGALPVVFGWRAYGKLERGFKLLLLYVLVSFLSNIIALLIGYFYGSNYFFMHFYTLLEYSLVILVFSNWQQDKVLKKTLLISIPIYVILWIIAKITIENFSELDSYTASLSAGIFIIIATITIIRLPFQSSRPLPQSPIFWASVAFLIYSGGIFFLYALTKVPTRQIWAIQNIVVIIHYLILTFTFHLKARE
ncbi:MAG: hypothetical protein V3U16_05245 [Candidatus Neomarinimicrobiota bacterium]